LAGISGCSYLPKMDNSSKNAANLPRSDKTVIDQTIADSAKRIEAQLTRLSSMNYARDPVHVKTHQNAPEDSWSWGQFSHCSIRLFQDRFFRCYSARTYPVNMVGMNCIMGNLS